MTQAGPERLFDRRRAARNRTRAWREFREGRSFFHDLAAGRLADRLLDIRRGFPLAASLGARFSLKAAVNLKAAGRIDTLILQDLAGAVLRPHMDTGPLLIADEECLPYAPASLDLVLSPFDLHAVNDLPGTLIQVRRILKPGGAFLAALPGGETLIELRRALAEAEIALRGGLSPRVAPMAGRQQMSDLMQRAGFALPVVDGERITLSYGGFSALMEDLRGSGEGNVIAARDSRPPGKRLFAEAESCYRALFSEEDGRLKATLDLIYVIGWAPN